MKIGLIGLGKMGRMVAGVVPSMGHELVAVEDAEVVIDFSSAGGVVQHVQRCALLGKDLVIGTTGWEEKLGEVRALVEGSKIGVLYAPNFSLGVHLFLRMLDRAGALMSRFPQYDRAGVEFHSRAKKDAPSGTGLEIARRVGVEMTSVRVGSIPGRHEVIFDSPYDTITISHEARSREGFARGALKAAEWLKGKRGFYTMDDFIERQLDGV